MKNWQDQIHNDALFTFVISFLMLNMYCAVSPQIFSLIISLTAKYLKQDDIKNKFLHSSLQ